MSKPSIRNSQAFKAAMLYTAGDLDGLPYMGIEDSDDAAELFALTLESAVDEIGRLRSVIGFVLHAISDCETIAQTEQYGSRVEALGAVAPEICERLRAELNR